MAYPVSPIFVERIYEEGINTTEADKGRSGISRGRLERVVMKESSGSQRVTNENLAIRHEIVSPAQIEVLKISR